MGDGRFARRSASVESLEDRRNPHPGTDALGREPVPSAAAAELHCHGGDEPCARSQLYDACRSEGTFIFYNVGPLAEHGKLDVIALGASQEEAEEAIEERLPKLLGI